MSDSRSPRYSPADSIPQSSKSYACIMCRKRKVKCDRNNPCLHCVKAQVRCEFRDPLPPRRRKKPQPEALLLARLRKYEDIMRKNGIDPTIVDSHARDAGEPCDVDDSTSRFERLEEHMEPMANDSSSDTSRMLTGQFISKGGRSIYLDSELLKAISSELPDSADILPESPEHDSDQQNYGQCDDLNSDGGSILFSLIPGQELADLHPKPTHILKLWQLFMEGVNPLCKLIHAPTLQQQIVEALDNLSSLPKELEAIMFAIYCVSIRTLSEEEVDKEFGESKTKLWNRYLRGAQLSLVNAGFLKTFDIMVLQAFLLFILSVRLVYDPHTLWALSAVAVRIAQRIGLHRDGSHLGLSIFETEIRRRVWWQLVIIDATLSHTSGSAPSPLPLEDTHFPLNINDSDLNPAMKAKPVEASGPTEMTYCLVQYEFRRWLHHHTGSKFPIFSISQDSFGTSSGSMAQKDQAVNELERTLETKFIRHCDSSIPLHLATLVVGRSCVLTMRLKARHPRKCRETDEAVSQAERDQLFSHCVRIAELTVMLRSTALMQRYLWNLDYHFPWAPVIYMLSDLRRRPASKEKAKAWELVDAMCYSRFKKFLEKPGRPLGLAVSNLGVKAWLAHVAECEARHQPALPQPEVVKIFQRMIQRVKPSTSSFQTDLSLERETRAPEANMMMPFGTGVPSGNQQGHLNAGMNGNLGPIDFDGIIDPSSINDSPMDWGQWDELLVQFQAQP